MGSSAGEHISIGGTNVCIGSQSGNGRNGDKNIFIGNRAGYSWDGGGSDNIILGNYAGFAYNATNSGNIFLGKYAGYDVSTDNNVYIGPRNTGRDASGSKNIFLRYDVGLNYSGSNILLIDNKNDNVSPFIRGDMQNDQLEINGEMIVKGNSVVKSVNVETLINMNEMTEFPVLPMEGDLIYLNDTLRFFTGVSWKNLW